MTELRPGKGAHFTVTEEVLNFVADTVDDIRNVYVDNDGAELVDSGEAFKVFNLVKSSDDWTEAKDKFGKKLYREIDWQGGAYRVTLVLNSHGELKLDIRYWYDSEA